MVTPGSTLPIVWKSRPVGSVSSSSRLTVSRREVFWTSTIGDSPVTVTVSSIAPTRISALTGAVKLASSTTPSRFTRVEPLKGEGHRIRPGPQIDHAVLTGADR